MFEQIGGNFSFIIGICCLGLAAFLALHAVGSGTNYTKFSSPSPASYMGPEWEGRVVVTTDFVEFSTTGAGASWYVGVLKPGEIFLFGYVSSDNILSGSTATLQVGDLTDTDRYMQAIAMSASSQNRFIMGASAGNAYYNGSTVNVPIILMTGTATITSGTAKVVIFKGRM